MFFRHKVLDARASQLIELNFRSLSTEAHSILKFCFASKENQRKHRAKREIKEGPNKNFMETLDIKLYIYVYSKL